MTLRKPARWDQLEFTSSTDANSLPEGLSLTSQFPPPNIATQWPRPPNPLGRRVPITASSARSAAVAWVWCMGGRPQARSQRRSQVPSRRTRERSASPQPFPAGSQGGLLSEPPEHLHDP